MIPHSLSIPFLARSSLACEYHMTFLVSVAMVINEYFIILLYIPVIMYNNAHLQPFLR